MNERLFVQFRNLENLADAPAPPNKGGLFKRKQANRTEKKTKTKTK